MNGNHVAKMPIGSWTFVRRWKAMTPVDRVANFIPDDRMCPTVVSDDDWMAAGRSCPHCGAALEPNQVVMASRDFVVQIHAQCVIEMYHRLPFTPESIDAEYERVRQELISEVDLHDE